MVAMSWGWYPSQRKRLSAEEVWQQVIRRAEPSTVDSVHLSTWPTSETELINADLVDYMGATRLLAEVGRAARKTSKVRTRQPLSRALIAFHDGRQLPTPLLEELARELNVKSLIPMADSGDIVDIDVKPNFRVLGRKFGNKTQQIAEAIRNSEPKSLVNQLRTTGRVDFVLGENSYSLDLDDIVIVEVPRSGWVVEAQRGVTVALDVDITPELAAEGVARDVVRVVQQARKAAGLDVSDRINLSLAGATSVQAAVRAHRSFVTEETLATSINVVDDLSNGFEGIVGAADVVTVNVTKASQQ